MDGWKKWSAPVAAIAVTMPAYAFQYATVQSAQVQAFPARALREGGTSLLPVGVVDVQGDFQAGDAVHVATVDGDGTAIGKGIANYSAAELRRIKGMKTAEVRRLMPRGSEEAVHRDYFVLD